MLAGERSTERGGELGDLVENSFDARTPVGTTHVDEGIHMHVRIAGVPEDHAARVVLGENSPDTADVRRELRRRNGRVLDELHRPKIRVELGEDWARGMPQLPQFRLRRLVERHANRRRTRLAEHSLHVARRRGRGSRVIALDLGEQRGLRSVGYRSLRASRRRDVEERAIEQLARHSTRRARATRGGDGVLDGTEGAQHATRRMNGGREREFDSGEQCERSFAADE